MLDPTDAAAITSARALIDFEPGSRTVPVTGPRAVGAGHSDPAGAGRTELPGWSCLGTGEAVEGSGTGPLCPSAGWVGQRAGS